MAMLLSTWRFEGELPTLERVVEAMRDRYSGAVDATFQTHGPIQAEGIEDIAGQGTEMTIAGVPHVWHTADVRTAGGEFELSDDPRRGTISARLNAEDESTMMALRGAIETLGGARVEAAQVTVTPAARRRLGLSMVVSYVVYAGIFVAWWSGAVGGFGAVGLVLLFWMVRLAVRIGWTVRQVRKTFPQLFQPEEETGPGPGTGVKRVESRVVNGRDGV